MGGSSSDVPESVIHFHQWRQSPEALLPGIGDPKSNHQRGFVALSTLRGYLTKQTVESLLDAVVKSSRQDVDAQYVLDFYLRPFAILLCMGEGGLIQHFVKYSKLRDGGLPFDTKPVDFPCTEDEHLFEKFKKSQWQFCAADLHWNMNAWLKEEEILPILRMDEIGAGGSATVYKIVIEEEYNTLVPKGLLSTVNPQAFETIND